jgi:hypothetical protein
MYNVFLCLSLISVAITEYLRLSNFYKKEVYFGLQLQKLGSPRLNSESGEHLVLLQLITESKRSREEKGLNSCNSRLILIRKA